MCGILLGLNLAFPQNEFDLALNSLSHRGPDEAHSLQFDNVFIGHTRLSIIGIDNGSQPFTSDDQQVYVLVNGEIYNHKSIRAELQALGDSFTTESDCEVVLHLYQRKGMSFLDELQGEYAGIVVDRTINRIFAFRDRFGVKPLFFASDDQGKLAIGSEVKALFSTGIIKPEIDPCSLRNMLSLIQPATIFRDIQVVPSRSFVEFDMECKEQHRPIITNYWQLDFPKKNSSGNSLSLEQTSKELYAHLERAIKDRLQSDAPLGVYLSGGLDSTAVCAIAAKHHSTPLNAFSIRFSELEKFDESEVAKRSAEQMGLVYHELDVTRVDILDNLESFLWHTEFPCANFSGVGKFLLSRLAHQHVKVVLTGEGSDEVFVGYDFFRKNPDSYLKYGNETISQNESTVKSGSEKVAQRIKAKIGHVPLEELKAVMSTGAQWFFNKLFAKHHLQELVDKTALNMLSRRHNKKETNHREGLVQTQIYTINNLLENYNLTVLGDRSEMANSIEGRPPFLDHMLFEYARTIPTEYKLTDDQSKVVLREAVRDIIPEEVYQGQKWPFLAPNYPVYRGASDEMDRLIDAYMSSEALKKLGVFSPGAVRFLMLMQRLFINSNRITLQLTALLSLILSTQIVGITFKQKYDKGFNQDTNS